MKRWVSGAAAMIGLLVSGSARADAAQDVKDIRAGQLPLRYEWLGWDSASAAHFRTMICSGGGTTACSAAFVMQAAEVPPKATSLLSVNEVYCARQGACAALDAATVSKFVAAEKAALASLPSTTRSAAEKDPLLVAGSVAGEATKLEVRTRDVSRGPDDTPHLQVELVVRGKGGASEQQDPRGVRLGCGDMTAALAGFTEATRIDATLGLGWYDRAAVESRSGDVADAKTSFDAALAIDPAFAGRACKDPDFAKLRTHQPSLFSCKSR